MLARDTLALDAAGQASVQFTLALLVIVGVMLLGWRLTLGALLGAPSPTLVRLSEWWERRSLRRLASRGLVALDCDDAPVLYRRVERHPAGGWEWEVRDGQTVLSAGHAARRSKAQRAASRACFARTFSAPYARRPGALYVLAPVAGNPYSVRVAEVLGTPQARHDLSAGVETRQ